MAFAYFDRIKETTTTTGVGVLALAGAVSGFRAFSAKFANGDTTFYTIYHSSSGAWEVGLGTWATGNTLARTVILDSSNAGAAVNFAAGTKDVFCTFPASVVSQMGAWFFTVADVTVRDAIPASLLRLGMIVRLISSGVFYHWTGAAWVVFTGFAPTGSAAGQAQIWNGSAWVAGALDLADPDAVTGLVSWANIALAMGNRALTGLKTLALNSVVDDTTSGAGTKNIDWTTGPAHKIQATGNATITFTAPPGPMGVQLQVTQDGTGGRVFTWPGGINGTAPTPPTGASTTAFFCLWYDGATYWWDNTLLTDSNWSSAPADRLTGAKVSPDFGAQTIKTTGPVEVGTGTVAATGSVRGNGNLALVGYSGSVDCSLVAYNSATPKITYGPGNAAGITGYLELNGAGAILKVSTNNGWSFTAAGSLINNTNSGRYSFASGATAPSFTQEDTGAVNATGIKLTIKAQTATNGTTVGGALDVGPGAGTTGGLGRLVTGGAAARFGWNDTGWATDGVTPIAQPARAGQLTDSSGGTPSGTIAAAGGAYGQANENDFRSSITQRMNAVETIIHNRGISA